MGFRYVVLSTDPDAFNVYDAADHDDMFRAVCRELGLPENINRNNGEEYAAEIPVGPNMSACWSLASGNPENKRAWNTLVQVGLRATNLADLLLPSHRSRIGRYPTGSVVVYGVTSSPVGLTREQVASLQSAF